MPFIPDKPKAARGFVPDKPKTTRGFVPDAEFNPEGTGYDYATALRYGLGPDDTGHWPSRVPQTGQILKGRKHETFSKTLAGEKQFGYNVTKGKDGRYYSVPKKKPRGRVAELGAALVRGELNVAGGMVGTLKPTPFDLNEAAIGSSTLFGTPINKQIEPVAERFQTAFENIKATGQKFERTREGTGGWALNVVGEAIPYMGAAFAGGVLAGPVGAASVGFAVEGQNAYDEHIELHPGDYEGAEKNRVIVGSINAALEALQISRLMKFHEAGKYSVKGFIDLARQKAGREMAKRGGAFTKDVLKIAIEEGIEEFSQEGVSIAVPFALHGDIPKTPDGKVDWWAIGERLGAAALGGAVAGGILGGAGRVQIGMNQVDATATGMQAGQTATQSQPEVNVYKTVSGSKTGLTEADIDLNKAEGRWFDKETGEDVILDTEASGSAIAQSQGDTFAPTVVQAEVGKGPADVVVGEVSHLDNEVQKLMDEGVSFEDARTVISMTRSEGATTEDITKNEAARKQLLQVEKGLEFNEDKPAGTKIEDKPAEPEFTEPGLLAIITNKRLLMERIGATKLPGLRNLIRNYERMVALTDDLSRMTNRVINSLKKQAGLKDRIVSKIMNRPVKPVVKMVELLDTYERLPEDVAAKLTDAEVEAFNTLRDTTKWLLERANAARRQMGLEPINDLKGYIPHWVSKTADEIMSGRYLYNTGFLGQLMMNVPKTIENPTAYHRRLVEKITDHMEKDLSRLMKGLIRYDLHDMLIANPLSQVWDELHALRKARDSKGNALISDRTYKYIADFIEFDILKKQTKFDRTFNDAAIVKTSTQLINRVLRPLNREIIDASRFYFGGFRNLAHAAFLPLRARPITRNTGQRLLNLTFFRGRDLLRAQFGKQDTIIHPETGKPVKVLDLVREQDWYKITKPEDTLDDNTLLSNVVKYGMIGFKLSHVGNRFVSNVEVSALTGYYDWKHRYQESHNEKSKHYKRIEKESKRTGIPIEQLQTQKEDMMNDIRDAVAMTQWEYMSHTMPTIIRGQAGRALGAYQSWWMNYFMSHLAEGYYRLVNGRTRVRSDGTGGRLLTPGARYRTVKGLGAIYGMARIAETAFGVALLSGLWMPDPTDGLPPILSLAVNMARLVLGFRQPEKKKQAWADLAKTARRMLPFSNAAREIAKVGDDWTLKDYVFYTNNEEWKQIWVPVEPKKKESEKGGL